MDLNDTGHWVDEKQIVTGQLWLLVYDTIADIGVVVIFFILILGYNLNHIIIWEKTIQKWEQVQSSETSGGHQTLATK